MGLDMYLYRAPRYNNTTGNQIRATELYLKWMNDKKTDSECSKHLNEWYGIKESDLPPKDAIEFYKKYYAPKYYGWDEDHKYPFEMIFEPVGYWRKANAVHKWFVDHVQSGEDDCKIHGDVSKEYLLTLKDICSDILTQSVLVNGKIKNGFTIKNGDKVYFYEDGNFILNPDVAESMLPSQDGFFFGSIEYDQYYIEDIKSTFDIISKVLATTDFGKQQIFYRSSW